ncbi:MAG: hypothetical protein OER21_13900 [Gemmatimonadota bacterium]|nr:hypothetical protein [Gemmatimonadota bacterium]
MFDDAHRDRLATRIAGGGQGQARKEVERRQLGHFVRADEDYGRRSPPNSVSMWVSSRKRPVPDGSGPAAPREVWPAGPDAPSRCYVVAWVAPAGRTPRGPLPGHVPGR